MAPRGATASMARPTGAGVRNRRKVTQLAICRWTVARRKEGFRPDTASSGEGKSLQRAPPFESRFVTSCHVSMARVRRVRMDG